MSSKPHPFSLPGGLVFVLTSGACASKAPSPAPTAALVATAGAKPAAVTAVSTAVPNPTFDFTGADYHFHLTPEPVTGQPIEDLRRRSYGGGSIETVRTMDSNAVYTPHCGGCGGSGGRRAGGRFGLVQ